MGPPTSPANPTYKQVCSGSTGHVEVYDFEYTGGADTYEALVKFFFQFHDPTTFNAQGGDTGTQYASVIYTYTPEQFEIASRVKSELQSHLDRGFTTSYANKQISTDVRTATTFFPAHGEHQAYWIRIRMDIAIIVFDSKNGPLHKNLVVLCDLFLLT